MPQDIPLEAGETRAFTPPSLAHIDNAPSFTIRTATWRQKNFYRRILRENSIIRHDEADIRSEIRKALQPGPIWGENDPAAMVPFVEEYWTYSDAFRQQKRQDPDLEWSYDPEIERRVLQLLDRVEQAWPQLARMAADNEEYRESEPFALIATMVHSWTGLDVARRVDRDHLTMDCSYELGEKLLRFEAQHGESGKVGSAFGELYAEAFAAMFLTEEERGNSASQSPSATAPKPSSAKPARGKSRASANSTKTRRSA